MKTDIHKSHTPYDSYNIMTHNKSLSSSHISIHEITHTSGSSHILHNKTITFSLNAHTTYQNMDKEKRTVIGNLTLFFENEESLTQIIETLQKVTKNLKRNRKIVYP